MLSELRTPTGPSSPAMHCETPCKSLRFTDWRGAAVLPAHGVDLLHHRGGALDHPRHPPPHPGRHDRWATDSNKDFTEKDPARVFSQLGAFTVINFVDGSFAALGTILEVTTKFMVKVFYNIHFMDKVSTRDLAFALHPWQEDFKTRSLCLFLFAFFLMEDQLEVASSLK